MKKIIVSLLALATLSLAGCGTAPTLQLQTQAAIEQSETLRVYDIEKVMGIGPAYAKKLDEAGFTNTKKFLAATRTSKDRAALAEKTGISNKLILAWAHRVELMEISGIGPEMSELLASVGVDSSKELAQRNATNLQDRLATANAVGKKFVDRVPSVNTVGKWIEKAKTMHTVES